MNTQTRLLIILNFGLGFFLWFFFSTDYSLPGTKIDLIFPVLVAVIGIVSFDILRKKKVENKSVIKWSVFPSIGGGCLYLLAGILFLMPPFTLGALFILDEMNNEQMTQQIESPNGVQVASVLFRPVGAYGGGNGHIYIRIRHKLLPFVERDIYYLDDSYASQETYSNYVRWIDNNTIYISETGQEIKIGLIKFEMPAPIELLLGILIFLFQALIEEWPNFSFNELT